MDADRPPPTAGFTVSWVPKLATPERARAVSIQQADGDRLAAFWCRDDLHADALSLNERRQSRPLDNRDVHEHVFQAVVTQDKAKTLVTLEPLHRSLDGARRRRIVALATA